MGKNQNTWSHRTRIIFREIKIIFYPLGSIAGFPARSIVLGQENVRGTRNTSLAGDRYNGHIRKALPCPIREEIDNVPMNLKYVCHPYFYMYVFSWFHSV